MLTSLMISRSRRVRLSNRAGSDEIRIFTCDGRNRRLRSAQLCRGASGRQTAWQGIPATELHRLYGHRYDAVSDYKKSWESDEPLSEVCC